MTRPPSPRGGAWPTSGEGRSRVPSSERGWPAARDDDGWGPSTAVYSSAAAPRAPVSGGRPSRAFYPSTPKAGPDQSWRPAGPRPSRDQRAVRDADRRTEASVPPVQNRRAVPERGLSWWVGLLLLVGIAVLGAIVGSIGPMAAGTGFNIGLVVGSIVAIIAVKRSHMFPVVIAPPIVFFAVAVLQVYVRSSGAKNHRLVLATHLVDGFPAMAAATAAVLIVAGFRLITRK